LLPLLFAIVVVAAAADVAAACVAR